MMKNDFVEDIDNELTNPTDKRIFAIAAAFYRGYTVEKIWQMTNIDKWFLNKLYNIHKMEQFLTYEISVHFPQYLSFMRQQIL